VKGGKNMAHIYKDMFVVSDAQKRPDFSTVSYQRKSSVEYFLSGTSLTWKEAYKLGYRCRRYDVQFTLKSLKK